MALVIAFKAQLVALGNKEFLLAPCAPVGTSLMITPSFGLSCPTASNVTS